MTSGNPEIGVRIDCGGLGVNVHDQGSGRPVVLIHGSGPGVSAWANWRLVIPSLAKEFRVHRSRYGGLRVYGPAGGFHLQQGCLD